MLLSGIAVAANHCRFEVTPDDRILLVCEDAAPDHLCVNGTPVTEDTLLEHNDRILLATNTLFLFK